jgi:hypothetical protein
MQPQEWSAEQTKKLVSLWESKELTMVEIAKLFGVTKNAIAGRIHRLRLNRTVRPRLTEDERERRRRVYEKKRWQKKKAARQIMFKPIRKPVVFDTNIPPPSTAPKSRNVALLARDSSECAYLVAKGICCGNRVKVVADGYGKLNRSSWCDYHYSKVFIKSVRKIRPYGRS